MKFVDLEDNPNPSLERSTDEECLATWWHQATPGTTYWRCLVPARHLPGQTLPFRHDDLIEDPEGQPFLPRMKGGTAIWQFLGDPYRTRVALGMKELYGIRTLMELDDNYLRPAPYLKGKMHSPWKETVEEAHKAGTNYSHEMHRYVVPLVDGLICSTDYLADIYSEYHDSIWVCPNSVDPADWEYEREEPDGIFRIVYYGSISHLQDAPLITKAMKWAARQSNVEVWTAGFDKRDWSFPHWVIPWNPELDKARANLFKFDLGVAPLRGNRWSAGKSDVKFLEHSMAGLASIVQRAEPFRPIWDQSDPPALVADTEDDWMAHVQWAVKNQDEVKQLASRARDYVLNERTIQGNIWRWKEALLDMQGNEVLNGVREERTLS